jgi:hypothetical protein
MSAISAARRVDVDMWQLLGFRDEVEPKGVEAFTSPGGRGRFAKQIG